MDYDDIILSIAYSFLDEVDYQPRSEEEEEEDEFEFYEWWDEINGYDVLFSIVDSYVVGSLQDHLQIILSSPTDPDELDNGLWVGVEDWKKITQCVAFEILRTDSTEWIREHVESNEPMFEPGGVLPKTTDTQIWFGKDAPTFVFNQLENEVISFPKVAIASDMVKYMVGKASLVFEGQREEGDPRDFKELALGGPPVMRPRRIYTQTADDMSVQEFLVSTIKHKWVSILDYERYKAVLPKLPVD